VLPSGVEFNVKHLHASWLDRLLRVYGAALGGLGLMASLVALPLSGMIFDGPVHDLAVAVPELEHHRWCVPERGTLSTRETLPFLLFGPLAVISLWCWWRSRRLRRIV
jgi:hypothetical protein